MCIDECVNQIRNINKEWREYVNIEKKKKQSGTIIYTKKKDEQHLQ